MQHHLLNGAPSILNYSSHDALNVYTHRGFWVFSSMPQTSLLVFGSAWHKTITLTPRLHSGEELPEKPTYVGWFEPLS